MSTANVTQTGQSITVDVTVSRGLPGTNGVGIPIGGTTGQRLAKASDTDYETEWITATAGEGDMTAAIYDPTNVAADAFAMDNMVEGVTKKILTVSERTAIATNSGKVSAITENIRSAGALMDDEVTNLAQVKAFNSADYATASHTHDDRYYTETETDSLLSAKEATANKSTTLSADQSSDTKYPSVKSVYDWAVGLFSQIGHTHVAANTTDFDSAVAANSAVVANTAKVSNIPTALSVGSVGTNTVGITSDGGADDVIIPAATVSTAGLLTTAKWAEIVANTAKLSATIANIASAIFGATAKTTPVDADTVGITDSADSNAGKKLTFASLWAWIKSKITGSYLLPVTLTSATTVSWNVTTGVNAVLVLAHNATVTLSNLANGEESTITITQGASAYSLTLAHSGLTVRGTTDVTALTNGQFAIIAIKRTGSNLFVQANTGFN